MPLTIRPMNREDIDFAVECTAAEGWLSETRDVFETALAYDRSGCLIAETDDRPVGLCIATAYKHFGFLGDLIVVPDRRGQGLGRQLMEQAITYLRGRGCQAIALDADLPAVPLYQRLGFRQICRSLRFLGTMPPGTSEGVTDLTSDDLAAIGRLDTEAFGTDRSFFIENQLRRFPHLCKVHRVASEPVAYLMAQPGRGVITIGPWLIADGTIPPENMLGSLAGSTSGQPLRLGVLETNQAAVRSLRTIASLEETEASYRMVLGEGNGPGDSPHLFAIGSPARG